MSGVIRLRPSRRSTDLSMVQKFMLCDLMLENREIRSAINAENGVPKCPYCKRHVVHPLTEELVMEELGL